MQTRWLKTRQGHRAKRIFFVVTHPHRIARPRTSNCSLVPQTRSRDLLPFAELAMGREEAISKNLDALVDLANAQAGHDRAYGLVSWSKRVTYEDDVDIPFERDDVTRGKDAAILFFVPAFVVFLNRFLRAAKRRVARREQKRAFTNDQDETTTAAGAIRPCRNDQWAVRDDFHGLSRHHNLRRGTADGCWMSRQPCLLYRAYAAAIFV